MNMSKALRSYLKYARGETRISPWMLFYPLQFITGLWMKLRIGLYEKGIFEVTEPVLPVISIGNNSLGGTNKTPMTELVVRQFKEAGIDAGLVSRGYRTKRHAPIWVGQDEGSKHRDIAGDEPLMLAKRLPGAKIVVSRDRVLGVALLASLGAQVAVTDDTFQHRKMARDVDIVLVDATCPFGNGQVIPAGLMREPESAFSRADIIVVTKSNQVTDEELVKTKNKLRQHADADKIFTAEIKLESWRKISNGYEKVYTSDKYPECRCIAFSAIGNPDGFYKFLEDNGVSVIAHRSYRDHHIFDERDLGRLEELAAELGADAFVCTEKDVVNLPENLKLPYPVYVPCIAVVLDDDIRFRRMISDKLRPRLIVASNGYGEDAIGVVLAKKLRARFKEAEISAFAFVGSGTHYKRDGFNVLSPASEMPSGGVIKYSLLDFFKDIRHGLGNSIVAQMSVLRSFRSCYRTPVCVGDVFLTLSMLFGYGFKPLLIATAKSVRLNGHMFIESLFLKKRSLYVWTRDAETAEELRKKGVNAEFCGNPVMDLIDNKCVTSDVWKNQEKSKILLLPGSRPRAYDDVRLILSAAKKLSKRMECSFVMVPAPMIDVRKLIVELDCWKLTCDGMMLESDGVKVKIFKGEVSEAARGADLLIGLGGTANQLCAGLGVPVVSILEKGKLRQKKLLKEAEVLVKADPAELAKAAEYILTTPGLKDEMKHAGIHYLGSSGALDHVVDFCATILGWDNRCRVYDIYSRHINYLADDKQLLAKELLQFENR